MDFFGNVQGVEIEVEGGRVGNESEWREDLRRLGEIWRRTREGEDQLSGVGGNNQTRAAGGKPIIADGDANPPAAATSNSPSTAQEPFQYHPSAVKIQLAAGWAQQILGAGALVACAVLWGGARRMEGGIGKNGSGGGGGGGGASLRRIQKSKKI